MEKIHSLQIHENADIYKKAYTIIDTYFGSEDEEDTNIVPQMDVTTGQYAFGGDMSAPPGGFQFGGGQM